MNPLSPATSHRPPLTAHAAAAGAATGLVPGVLVLGAQQLGGVLGMPGAAVRYVLLTGALLALAALPLTRRLVARCGGHPRGALRCALAACLLVALAGAVPGAAVFCGAVLVAAPLGAAAFALRIGAAWYPGALAGLAVSGAVVALLPDRPATAVLLCAAAGALLLLPAALSRRALTEPAPEYPGAATAGGAPHEDPAAPGHFGPAGPAEAQEVAELPTRPGLFRRFGRAGRRAPAAGAASGPDTSVARIAHAALGFAVGAGALAAQDFLTFRFELLGAEQAGRLGAAAAGAALLCLLWRLPADGVSAARARRGAATLLAGACATLLALATASGPDRLAVSLGALLACAALTGRLLDRAFTGRRPDAYAGWVLLGALLGIGALSGLRGVLDAGDALALCALPPLVGTVLTARTAALAAAHRVAAEPLLRVHDLTVRRGGRTEIRRLRLVAAPGDVLVLRDERSGQRAAALLRVLAGLDRPAGGSFRLHGQDVRRMNARSRWLLGLSAAVDPVNTGGGVLPQLASDRSVGEALRAAAERHGPAHAPELEQGALAAFPALRERLEDSPADLEPAERCVLALAQTLLARPRLLLLDLTSPAVAALADDPQLASLVRRIAGQGATVLVATAGTAATPLGGRLLDLTERRPPRAGRTRRTPAAPGSAVPPPRPSGADEAADLHERKPA
ncbi:hypothetical protein AB0L71_08990 [Streptomyces sp. NPDC052052]|uniref:hypothetical protein n=1 Tax=Streptomyces sp. NPDC052052 TaxID=3154756 RepID=UPI0034266015